METIKWAVNHMPKTEDANLPVMALSEVEKARTFHESFPQYSVTPLVKLNHMAEKLGLGSLYIKDESYRFGLNAFKVLGGSFAMARYIAQQTGKDVSELPYNILTSEALKKEFGQATFFTATDGNHGRGVAWAANKLGQKAVVLMPKGSTQTRLNNIRKKAPLLRSKNATTMNACAWLPIWLPELNMVSSCRILRGTAMKKFRHGSCRDTEPWPWKPTINFMKTAAKPRLMYLSRLVSDPLPVLFRDILRTAIPRPRRKWSLWKPKRLPAFTKELLPETVRSAL